MYLGLVAFHVVLCFLMVLIVILQPGKNGDVGAAFGGAGSAAVFGPRGPTSALQRLTTIAAVLFFMTSMSLAYLSDRSTMQGAGNVMEELERRAAERQAKDAAETSAQTEAAPASGLSVESVPEPAAPVQIPAEPMETPAEE